MRSARGREKAAEDVLVVGVGASADSEEGEVLSMSLGALAVQAQEVNAEPGGEQNHFLTTCDGLMSVAVG